MRTLILSLAFFASQAWAFSSQELISIDCKALNGVDIKTSKIENGKHIVDTNWFGMTKSFRAVFVPSTKESEFDRIELRSSEQTYFLEGKIEKSNPSQSITFDLLAKHPSMRMIVTQANCQLEFTRN